MGNEVVGYLNRGAAHIDNNQFVRCDLAAAKALDQALQMQPTAACQCKDAHTHGR
jgi:hypothetical protein